MGKPNGFFVFMQEQKRLNKDLNCAELMVLSDTLWREKRKKELSYKTNGRTVVEILKLKREREREETDKTETVINMVEMAAQMGTLETKIFYVMHLNVFLVTEEYPTLLLLYLRRSASAASL